MVLNLWQRCLCFQAVANQIDLWNWFAESANLIELESFASVAAVAASVAVAQVAAR